MKSKEKSKENLTIDVVNHVVGVFLLRNWIDFEFGGWILKVWCVCVRHCSSRGRGRGGMVCLVMDFAEEKAVWRNKMADLLSVKGATPFNTAGPLIDKGPPI
ncbi:hypothetical protein Tco_0282714 [Tanacetum coccineum]